MGIVAAKSVNTVTHEAGVCMSDISPKDHLEDWYYGERLRMVEKQIEKREIHDQHVLEAVRKVPRHLFVPEQYRDQAYEDHPVGIGEGQTISQPYIVALMTELLHLPLKAKVLEVGTGSGYQTAVLAEMADAVYTIEIISKLVGRAKEILKKLNYINVFAKEGDGYLGWPEEAPFDGIIVTAAPPNIPESLVQQLKEGGRLVIPVGYHSNQNLYVVQKVGGEISKKEIIPVSFVPMVRRTG